MQEEMDLTGMYIAIDDGEAVEGAIDPKTGKNITISGQENLAKPSEPSADVPAAGARTRGLSPSLGPSLGPSLNPSRSPRARLSVGRPRMRLALYGAEPPPTRPPPPPPPLGPPGCPPCRHGGGGQA